MIRPSDLDMSELSDVVRDYIHDLEQELDTLSKPRVVSDEEIENETFKTMLTDEDYSNLPDYYVKQIVVKVLRRLITQ